jgi:patatin-like phospholipase/acyl hydrolase
MTVLEMIQSTGPKKILALDGGGVRGMIAVDVLGTIESLLRVTVLGTCEKLLLKCDVNTGSGL